MLDNTSRIESVIRDTNSDLILFMRLIIENVLFLLDLLHVWDLKVGYFFLFIRRK